MGFSHDVSRCDCTGTKNAAIIGSRRYEIGRKEESEKVVTALAAIRLRVRAAFQDDLAGGDAAPMEA